jgi:4'-phosphopantetheinyl transferase
MLEPADIAVHILRLPPADAAAQEAFAPPAWLANEDRVRCQSMRSMRRRAEFIAGRLLLRHAMSVRHPGTSWRLIAPEGAAPQLSLDAKLAAVVSIAHSAGIVACALSETRRLGIDLEHRIARKRDVAGLAPAVLHPLEAAALALQPQSRQHDFFLGCWTLKEALAKALGEGLSLPFRKFAFDGCRLAAAPGAWSGMHEHWTFARPEAGADAMLGLAWSTAGEAQAASVSVQEVELQQLQQAVAR